MTTRMKRAVAALLAITLPVASAHRPMSAARWTRFLNDVGGAANVNGPDRVPGPVGRLLQPRQCLDALSAEDDQHRQPAAAAGARGLRRHRHLRRLLQLHQRERDRRDAEGRRQQCGRVRLQPGDRHRLPRMLEDHAGVQPEGSAHEQSQHQQLRDGAGAGRRHLAEGRPCRQGDLRGDRQFRGHLHRLCRRQAWLRHQGPAREHDRAGRGRVR